MPPLPPLGLVGMLSGLSGQMALGLVRPAKAFDGGAMWCKVKPRLVGIAAAKSAALQARRGALALRPLHAPARVHLALRPATLLCGQASLQLRQRRS